MEIFWIICLVVIIILLQQVVSTIILRNQVVCCKPGSFSSMTIETGKMITKAPALSTVYIVVIRLTALFMTTFIVSLGSGETHLVGRKAHSGLDQVLQSLVQFLNCVKTTIITIFCLHFSWCEFTWSNESLDSKKQASILCPGSTLTETNRIFYFRFEQDPNGFWWNRLLSSKKFMRCLVTKCSITF